MTTVFISGCLLGGLFLAWRHGAKCYDRGITDAILMHNSGRLRYNSYLDESGSRMVNIEIDPLDD